MWAVGLHGADPVKGRLSLEDQGLSFSPADGPGLRIQGPSIRGVRRLRASPALKVTYDERTGPREVFFFFAKPPPLPEPSKIPGLSLRGAQRTVGAMDLRAQSRRAREEIQAWVVEIRRLGRG